MLNEVFGKTRGPGLFRVTANAFGRLCETIQTQKPIFYFLTNDSERNISIREFRVNVRTF
ncbi:hypothetical protein LEP1GSC040_0246 [Leptospira santarosai str. 2000030832]|nr:hypothetical protein LEP1GSC040_0246 [Leptospira santarosai str. 2000030832]